MTKPASPANAKTSKHTPQVEQPGDSSFAALPWYSRATAYERRVFAVCFGGWALDALDVQMLSLALPAILAVWGLSKANAGLMSTVSLAASALGGWLAGAMTDRFGRVRLLQITVACFSIFSFLSAFAQNLHQLVALKALQGLGFGGEWAVGSVLLAEVVDARYRGKALATVQSGWAVGWGAAVLLYMLLSSTLPAAIGWRVMFGLGLLPALLIVYVQRSIQEPARAAVSAPASRHRPSGWKQPFEIFARGSLRMTFIGSLLGVGAHGGYYAVSTWLPTYLRTERHLTVLGTGAYLAVIIVAFWCGCMASGSIIDKIGRRKTILFFAVCCVITVALYLFAPIGKHSMLFLGFPLGFFSAGIPSSMGTLFSELYPHGARGTGVGFCYNFGRIVAAILPVEVGKLSVTLGLRYAIGIYAVAAYALVVVATLMLPETKGKELT